MQRYSSKCYTAKIQYTEMNKKRLFWGTFENEAFSVCSYVCVSTVKASALPKHSGDVILLLCLSHETMTF